MNKELKKLHVIYDRESNLIVSNVEIKERYKLLNKYRKTYIKNYGWLSYTTAKNILKNALNLNNY